MKSNNSKCPICGGTKIEGKVTFTVDLKDSLIVIRNTPATICSLCGEEWISDEVAESIEGIVNEAKDKNRVIEVVNFSYEKVA